MGHGRRVRWYPTREDSDLTLRADLLSAGVDPSDVDKAVRRKVVIVLQRGVYVPGDHRVNVLDRARAAVVAVGGCRVVASHRTAARVHGLDAPAGGPEEVTIPRDERRPHRSGLVFHTSRLAPDDVVTIGGVEMTSVARTLVDLCRGLDDRTPAVWAVERALALGRVTCPELTAALSRLARSPGIRRAAEWIRLAEPASGSPLETAARLALFDAGLPPPELQVRVVRADGRVAYLDLAYPEVRVGLEMDGRSEHGMELAVFDDRDRENQVVAREWKVYRFSWADVHQRRARFVRTVASAIRR